MDGGRMLMASLWKRRGRQLALATTARVARALAVLMVIWGLVSGSGALVLIAVLVWWQAGRSLLLAPQFGDPMTAGVGRTDLLGPLRQRWRQRQERRRRRNLAQQEESRLGEVEPSAEIDRQVKDYLDQAVEQTMRSRSRRVDKETEDGK